MSLRNDPTLRRLARERVVLLQKLAPVLPRAGPQHPTRSKENRRRTQLRKELKHQLNVNAIGMVTHIMRMYLHLTPED